MNLLGSTEIFFQNNYTCLNEVNLHCQVLFKCQKYQMSLEASSNINWKIIIFQHVLPQTTKKLEDQKIRKKENMQRINSFHSELFLLHYYLIYQLQVYYMSFVSRILERILYLRISNHSRFYSCTINIFRILPQYIFYFIITSEQFILLILFPYSVKEKSESEFTRQKLTSSHSQQRSAKCFNENRGIVANYYSREAIAQIFDYIVTHCSNL